MSSSSLVSFILRRLLESIPLFFLIIILMFFLVHIAPGDPLSYLVGTVGVSPEYEAMMRERLGLDKSIVEQLLIYIELVMRGDLGYSLIFNSPVLNLILERLPASILLMSTSLLFAMISGIILGVTSSKKPYSLIDSISTTLSLLGSSLPVFWLAQMLILLFALYFNILPTGGIASYGSNLTGIAYITDRLIHLILPTISLGLVQLPIFTRLTRASMLEELGKDYIVAARSKGLKETTVTYRHALRNALNPVMSIVGVNIGWLLAGSVLTETVYGWPGLGRLMFDSITKRDYPIVTGIFMFVSIAVICINLIIDILYAFIDPRVRYK